MTNARPEERKTYAPHYRGKKKWLQQRKESDDKRIHFTLSSRTSCCCSFSSPEPLGLICNRPLALDATENTNFLIGWRQLNAQSKLKISSAAHKILLRACKHEVRVWVSLMATILVSLYAIAVKKRIAGKVWEVSTKTTSLDKESIAFVVR